jgi:hypothetical protein
MDDVDIILLIMGKGFLILEIWFKSPRESAIDRGVDTLI